MDLSTKVGNTDTVVFVAGLQVADQSLSLTGKACLARRHVPRIGPKTFGTRLLFHDDAQAFDDGALAGIGLAEKGDREVLPVCMLLEVRNFLVKARLHLGERLANVA